MPSTLDPDPASVEDLIVRNVIPVEPATLCNPQIRIVHTVPSQALKGPRPLHLPSKDIVNDVKFAWKVQRDVAERGWTEEQA